MTTLGGLEHAPAGFLAALGALRGARVRGELALHEIPAPSRLAPYAVALGADVAADAPARTPVHGPARLALGDADTPELAHGRFILLHDPDGSPVWDGQFRIVTYIRAELEPEMGNDAMLGSVAWTWLQEALAEHHVTYRQAGGTATRILSESYGSLADRPDAVDIELRASWTPADADVGEHLEAWGDMVCTFAGLPPLPEGVASLRGRRLT
ncbi:enoyl-CoA hydratase [Tersicoccus phoenicis]|uniref:Enoyl-CoA hydratase n=1 Tax=Tersicoccus phoenicis TaxID=554083 RepID=A0A1R1LQ61_9MICC|nr:DUF3000 domain-containing protein [Tersicoccus phoenicis]OMH29674.1 enoyl-CoA hydratase [Tersicoccus phoenicis]